MTGCSARSHKADIAQQAERGHSSGRGPGFDARYPLQHLIAGVFGHNGRACVPRSAGTAGMCDAGTPAPRSESTFQRSTALAPEHNRNGIRPEAFVSTAPKAEIGRKDWAAPEPVTGWNTRACSSVGRAPDSKPGGRGSIPCVPARHSFFHPRDSQAVEGGGLQVRRHQAHAGSNPAPESRHPLVAEMADATVSEAVAERHARSTRAEETTSTPQGEHHEAA